MLVGINLLREGLDIPEVSLVAILDADKEGYLRSERSLIQTAGRAARHAGGRVILFGDTMTESMKRTIEITTRRRSLQATYNEHHHITPETIKKGIPKTLYEISEADCPASAPVASPDPRCSYGTEHARLKTERRAPRVGEAALQRGSRLEGKECESA